ncbi:MAG TPA: two-component regulator propeller domain-containing protein [Vicinamibacterales bacterium]
MFKRFSLVLVLMWLHPATALAVDPDKRITQYAHTGWRSQDGVFAGTPFAIVQTPEGYIWIGTADGILQFDGVHFVRWTPGNGQRLPNSEVLHLRTTRDGSVWISAVGFLSRWKGHTLTNYATGASGVPDGPAEDNDGTVWIGRAYPRNGTGSLCQVQDTDLRCLGSFDGIPSFNANSSLADRDGTLWIGGDTLLLRWAHGTPTVYRPPGLAGNAGIHGVGSLAQSADGGLWVGIGKAGPGLGLQRFIEGRWQSFDTPTFHGSSVQVTALHADRGGALWVGTYDRGIYRIRGDVVDHFDRSHGLSGDHTYGITEDREGNVWVVTTQGVDRFAETPVASVSVAEGLCSPEAISVIASRDGSIWTGGDGGLTRLRDGSVTCFRSGHELPGSQVTSLFEDHAGRLWVGLDQGLWVYEGGRFQMVTRADARPIGLVTGIAEDRATHLDHRGRAAADSDARRGSDGARRCPGAADTSARRVRSDRRTVAGTPQRRPGARAPWADRRLFIRAFGRRVARPTPARGGRLRHRRHELRTDWMAGREETDAHPEEWPAVRAGLCHRFRRWR